MNGDSQTADVTITSDEPLSDLNFARCLGTCPLLQEGGGGFSGFDQFDSTLAYN